MLGHLYEEQGECNTPCLPKQGIEGWQPRWFVLDNGILSYYDSQDDVCKGSKGSIKMAVCEIKGAAAPSKKRPPPFTDLSDAAEPTRTQTPVMTCPLKTQRGRPGDTVSRKRLSSLLPPPCPAESEL
ncbi:hypothetical protein STEG23_017991 [Scotinomys teguina]